MAAAQRWSRKRGWAAAFQGAEVVGQHKAANRGGLAMGGPPHISSSVPTQFEAMLEEAAVLAPEGVEHPLQYLRSRILARLSHAMLKRGVTLVTVYLEPGMRASGLNLWVLEVLAACILCFDGHLDRNGRLAFGAERPVSGRLARHGQRQGFRLIGGNLCRRSGRSPRLLRAVRGDGTFGATGQSGGQLSHYSTFACQSHSHCHVLGSQSPGAKTAKAVPHGGASGTATPGGTFRLDQGSRGAPCRP